MTRASSGPAPWLWLNGHFLPEQDAGVSPMDRGFQYGDGVFETIRMERGRPLYLEQHLRRLDHSLSQLRISMESPPDWQGILTHLSQLNQMNDRVGAAKILVTRGVDARMGTPPCPRPTLCCFLRPFNLPEEAQYKKGYRLHLYRGGPAPALARHKSLNYLYFQIARQAAFDLGMDESILLDCRGRITETSAGALMMRTGTLWRLPSSPHRLASTTLDVVTSLLQEQGHTVTEQEIFPPHLETAETIWVLNSLLGIMPAGELDGSPVPEPLDELAHQLRKLWVERGTGQAVQELLKEKIIQ